MKKISLTFLGIIMAISAVCSIKLTVPANAIRHTPGLDVYFYETPEAAHFALINGEVDIAACPLTYEQYLEVALNPAIQLAAYAENGLTEFDINNNYTIPDFPGVRNPMNLLEFRQAIAHMVDKDTIITSILSGLGKRIDAPICAPQEGFADPSVVGPNYPYPFDLVAAAALLDGAGFVDIEPDGIRNYPAGWPGRSGQPNLDPIKCCWRSDHLHRLEAGRLLSDNMAALGIPLNLIEASKDVLFPIVMDDLNYQICTGSWMLGRYPTYMWNMFHTDNFFSGGSGYSSHAFDAAGNPNYPIYDTYLENIRYATSLGDFQQAVLNASKFHVENCISIPLWSYTSFFGYSKYLVGIVNADGYGPVNPGSCVNAYKVDNPLTPEDESQHPIRVGAVGAPGSLNPIYPKAPFVNAALDASGGGLISSEPYNLAIDTPAIAQDWEVSTWYDFQDDETATKVTYYLRGDVYWYEYLVGQIRQFTAHDLEFTLWYIACFDNSPVWPAVQDIKFTHLVDDFTLEVYFDSESIWHVYNPTGLLPKYELIDLGLLEEHQVQYDVIDPIVPSDKVVLPTDDNIVQIINVTKYPEDIPLIQGIDFEIFYHDRTHNEIHWLRPLDPGEWMVFNYYTALPGSADGYYLGGLDWDSLRLTLGPLYLIDFVPGIGGQAIFEDNPDYHIANPPLGEIDWKWTFTGTVKPRSGYFQVFLYDAVKLLQAYCKRGDGAHDPGWFAGADIDATDLCHVGLYDAVTILGKYGQKYGIPPFP